MFDTRCPGSPLRRALCSLLAAACLCAASPSAAAGSDVVDTLCGYRGFKIFCELIELAGLSENLRTRSPLTVFAPTDKAFERLEPGTLALLKRPQNHPELRQRLLYHLVPARLEIFDLRQERPVQALAGKQVRFLMMHDKVMINDAFIDREDILASNGVIHGIDKVLVPAP